MDNLNSDKKVLFVHSNSDIVAGQEISLLNRIKGLKEKGVKTIVAVNGNGIFFNLLKENNIEVRNLTLRRIRKVNPFPFFRTVFQVYRLIKQERVSIVHCSGAYPNQYCLPAARLARIPCVVHVNSAIYTREDFVKSFLNYADAIIAVSDAVKKHIINSLGVSSEKVIVSYNGLKIKKIFDAVEFVYFGAKSDSSENIRKKFNIGDNVKIVGQISQIIPRKGVEYFIKMASIVKSAFPNTKFLLIGSAPAEYLDYELEQKRLVSSLGLNQDVIFTGFQKDIIRIIKILDISVLCSLEEGLGRVIIESLALGKPVVGTDVGGMPEIIINNQTGFLVPPKDPEALAEAVIKLLKDPQKAKMMGTAGINSIADKFNIERHTESILNIYNSLLN